MGRPYVLAGLLGLLLGGASAMAVAQGASEIRLPAPRLDSDRSIESALNGRRTVRAFAPSPISLADLGQLLWAAQGITSPRGFRTAPSAGALYPLETYVLAGDVAGLAPGVYHYRPDRHRLVLHRPGDRRAEAARAALGQSWMTQSAAVLAFSGNVLRTARKYGRRSERYVHMEAGHAAQNVLLQTQALGLAAGLVGAFRDDELAAVLTLQEGERPLYLIPIGKGRTP